jgi:hypothetical protein
MKYFKMISVKNNISNTLPPSPPPFNTPNNFEHSRLKRKWNISNFININFKIIESSRKSTLTKLQLMGRSVEGDKIFDDEIVRTISKEFTDKVTSLFVIEDVIRSIWKPIKRKEITADEFGKHVLDLITSAGHIFREEIMQLTKIAPVFVNVLFPFMNGRPEGEHWNKATNGFYNWIDNKSKESVLGIGLGFKADNYGLEVNGKLI